MKQELPNHLHSTCDLLASSLQLHAVEKAPTIPGDLLSDMVSRFNPAPVVTAKAKPMSLFATLQAFIARPSFGVAALAMVILAFSLPSLLEQEQSASGFRGAVSEVSAAQSLSIVLVKAPDGISQLLENSGDFEAGVITSADSTDNKGPKIIVDFESATIKAIDANGGETFSSPLPEDRSSLSAAIAKAVTRL